jgi:YD repeat-containing protein
MRPAFESILCPAPLKTASDPELPELRTGKYARCGIDSRAGKRRRLARFPGMPSSVIRAFEYDAEAHRLAVTFTTGRRYAYRDVPPAIAEGLRAAGSKGGYFNRRIRDHFAFDRLR